MSKQSQRQPGVVVIDDDETARLLVEVAVEQSDVLTLLGSAENGLRGVEAAARLAPDVIILDINMPVMDGYDALPLLRAAAPDAVILVRSGLVDSGEVATERVVEASELIPSLLDPHLLTDRIERAVSRHRASVMRRGTAWHAVQRMPRRSVRTLG